MISVPLVLHRGVRPIEYACPSGLNYQAERKEKLLFRKLLFLLRTVRGVFELSQSKEVLSLLIAFFFLV